MRVAIALRAGFSALILGWAGGALADAAQAPELVALTKLERGQWELKPLGERGPARRICLGDPRALLQLRHVGEAGCSRFIIANDSRTATVHYTCPGAGHGRTTVTVTTPRALRIETQGIADNAPFDVAFEARRTGGC